ncbi:MAG: biotin--[Bacteroidales bacterium]|nr:biotin--[acetyl-CoA-carboxylase] ligase [Bacteroidales bacterium]
MESKFTILWLDRVDSTNDEAVRRMETLDNLSVIAAVEQFSGRGRRGNSWHSAPGDNLTFSIVLKGNGGSLEGLSPSRQFAISRLSALTICDFLSEEGVDARIKWPNDIYIGNRKVCGMLIENSVSAGALTRSVIGIGLNLNEKDFPPYLVNPTSLTIQNGREYALEPVLERICGFFLSRLPMLGSEDGLTILEKEYHSRLYRLGEWKEYRNLASSETFEGRIDGVTDKGYLKVTTREGLRKEFALNEIGYII